MRKSDDNRLIEQYQI